MQYFIISVISHSIPSPFLLPYIHIWCKSQQVFNFYFHIISPIHVCVCVCVCVCIFKVVFLYVVDIFGMHVNTFIIYFAKWTTLLPPSLCCKNNTAINTLESDSLNISISTALCNKWKWCVKVIYIFNLIRVVMLF